MAVKSVKITLAGVTHELTYDSASGSYKVTLTAPVTSSYNVNAEHYYPVSVVAEDQAGNKVSADDKDPSLGSALRLRVKEKVAPVITVTSPAKDARITNSRPAFQWTVTDNDSGVDPAKLSITLNGTKITDGITAVAIEGGYSCSYQPGAALPEGSNSARFDAADFDGNAATQVSTDFVIDTVAPSLNVATPTDGAVTNEETCTVTGTTSDATSGPAVVTIKVNNVDQGAVAVDEGGNFSKDVALTGGLNTIEVTATDQAGKSTTITRTVTLDTTAPVITNISLTPNPADCGATLIIAVTVQDE